MNFHNKTLLEIEQNKTLKQKDFKG